MVGFAALTTTLRCIAGVHPTRYDASGEPTLSAYSERKIIFQLSKNRIEGLIDTHCLTPRCFMRVFQYCEEIARLIRIPTILISQLLQQITLFIEYRKNIFFTYPRPTRPQRNARRKIGEGNLKNIIKFSPLP